MHRTEEMSGYLLTFSSFYQAMYARDKLAEHGIKCELRRAPTQLLRSCGQALYLTGGELQEATTLLSENQIEPKSVFLEEWKDGSFRYRRIQ